MSRAIPCLLILDFRYMQLVSLFLMLTKSLRAHEGKHGRWHGSNLLKKHFFYCHLSMSDVFRILSFSSSAININHKATGRANWEAKPSPPKCSSTAKQQIYEKVNATATGNISRHNVRCYGQSAWILEDIWRVLLWEVTPAYSSLIMANTCLPTHITLTKIMNVAKNCKLMTHYGLDDRSSITDGGRVSSSLCV